MGTLLLSWSLVLITRLDFLDEIFDGLTNVYAIHKKISIIGMILIFVHIIALVIERLPSGSHAFNLFFPVQDQLFMNIGAISFWAFILFIIIILMKNKLKIPYHIWKFIHKFAGFALVLAFVHILLISRDGSTLLHTFWLISTTGIGIASWIYYEIFYKSLAPSYKYRVSEIVKAGDVFKIKLAPIGNKI